MGVLVPGFMAGRLKCSNSGTQVWQVMESKAEENTSSPGTTETKAAPLTRPAL